MSEYHLAQFNVGRPLYELDDPRMTEFMDNLNRINTLAENHPGFVWRLVGENNNATDIEVLGETSNLQDAMVKIGSRAIENTMESITKMASILRVISLLMLTIFIGWTFSSIQSITQGIAAAAVG